MVNYSMSNALLSDELTGRQYSLARYGGPAFYEDLMFHHWLESGGKHYFVLLHTDYFGDRGCLEIIKYTNGPFELNKRMNPVDFVSLGDAELLPPEAMTVTATSEEVVWRSPRLEMRCRPPEWSVRGGRGDLAVDLNYRSCAPGFIFDGGLVRGAVGRAFWHPTEVNGTLELNGERLQVTGRAVREHTTFQQIAWRMKFDWIVGFFDPELYFVLYTQPEEGRPGVRCGLATWTNAQGSELFNFEDVSIKPVAKWADPSVGQEIAQQWRIVARSGRATLELDAYGLTRIWHVVPRPVGTFLMIDYNIMLEGEWTGPDGKRIPLTGGRAYLQTGAPK